MQVPPFSLSRQIAELGNDLDTAVLRVLRSGQYIGGKEVESFEESFAHKVGVPYAIGCNSGTDALILALRALDIGHGDEVITCAFSFFATAEAISAVGAKPVFVEIDPVSFLIEIDQVEKAITPLTKAVLPVHLFGCPVNMNQLMMLAKENSLKVIEDCAQATGAEWNGLPVGSWGDVGCFSFFPTKNLGAAGDAGAVTTKESDIARRVRELAIHGMPKRYIHNELGYNSRLDAIQAAILNVKLPQLSNWVRERKAIADRYIELLKDIPGLEIPNDINQMKNVHAWNQFVVRVKSFPKESSFLTQGKELSSSKEDDGLLHRNPRDWLKTRLEKIGIKTIIYYPIPIHLQPAYSPLNYKVGSLPITEKACREVLSLPIYPEITIEEQELVAKEIRTLMV